MNFKKTQMSKDVWIIEFAGKEIPLEAIGTLVKFIALSILIVLAYSIGQFNASEYIKWNAFFHGNLDPQTNLYLNCWVEQSGISVAWKCEDLKNPKNISYTIPTEDLNNLRS